MSDEKTQERPKKSKAPVPKVARRSVNLSISEESHERGAMHAIKIKSNLSAIVEAYLMTLPVYEAKTSK
jgi:hypothetical protein